MCRRRNVRSRVVVIPGIWQLVVRRYSPVVPLLFSSIQNLLSNSSFNQICLGSLLRFLVCFDLRFVIIFYLLPYYQPPIDTIACHCCQAEILLFSHSLQLFQPSTPLESSFISFFFFFFFFFFFLLFSF